MSPVIPIELIPAVQQYSWGKLGVDSLVARLTGRTSSEPFAELWLGSHRDGAVRVYPETTLLSDYLVQHNLPPLPFLFKVLSVGDALSIQTHPTPEQAVKLHIKNAAHYPDGNAKPEASVALSPVELLYGFRCPEEIRRNINENKELAQLIDFAPLQTVSDKDLIALVFTAVMSSSKEKLEQAAQNLKTRLEQQTLPLTSAQRWICELQPRYRSDPGIFCFLLLNFVELAPGQSLFIAPGVVHAYLSGDMLECMANSNNVVRAGLTPKFCDVDTLLDIAALTHQPISLTQPVTRSKWQTFEYPAEEFTISLLSPCSSFTEAANEAHQIWLCLEQTKGTLQVGETKFELSPGKAYLLPSTVGSYTVTLSAGQIARAMARSNGTT